MEIKTACPYCKNLSNKCFVEQTEIEGKPFSSFMCFNCGMTSNSYLAFDSDKLEEYTKNNSALMNDLKVMDEQRGIWWFPSVINMGEKGIIYPEGTVNNWHWYYAKVIDIPEEDREKYDGHERRLDVENAEKFGQFEFIAACQSMGIIKEEEFSNG